MIPGRPAFPKSIAFISGKPEPLIDGGIAVMLVIAA